MADRLDATGVNVITNEDNGRAFVPKRGDAPYPQGFEEGQEARYRPKRYGLVMNVTITKCKKDEANGKWLYQAKDSAQVPVKAENSDEPIWIPEGNLVKNEAGGDP